MGTRWSNALATWVGGATLGQWSIAAWLVAPLSFSLVLSSPSLQERAELACGQTTPSTSHQIQIATTKTSLTSPNPPSTSSRPSPGILSPGIYVLAATRLPHLAIAGAPRCHGHAIALPHRRRLLLLFLSMSRRRPLSQPWSSRTTPASSSPPVSLQGVTSQCHSRLLFVNSNLLHDAMPVMSPNLCLVVHSLARKAHALGGGLD